MQPPTDRFRWTPVFWVLAISAGGFTYRLFAFHHLGLTDPLFVGIPVLLAVIIAATPKAKTTTGSIVKATTLVLLLLAPLGEGFIGILLMAPFFYAASIACGVAFHAGRG